LLDGKVVTAAEVSVGTKGGIPVGTPVDLGGVGLAANVGNGGRGGNHYVCIFGVEKFRQV
jgi:hypothetical protein